MEFTYGGASAEQIVHCEVCNDVFLCICRTSIRQVFYRRLYGVFSSTYGNDCFVLLPLIAGQLLIVDILGMRKAGVFFAA